MAIKMAEIQQQQHPDMVRLRELLAQPGLLAREEAELRHLAALHGIALRWERYDLDVCSWSPAPS